MSIVLPPFNLERFTTAQDPVWQKVRQELAAGLKRTHWMWFVFPQLDGMGSSAMSRQYALTGLDEARAFLDHPVLGRRLLEGVGLVLSHADRSIRAILGPPDDLKFQSCMTLFRAVAEDHRRALFQRALDVFYDGEPCGRTLAMLVRA